MTGVLKQVYWWLAHPALKWLAGLPSPKAKARLINRTGRELGTLVETGTYLGDTVNACLPHFDRIYTIELDPTLAGRARARFADEPAVTVIEGDSEHELPRLASEIEEPVVFWLDAHFCDNNTARGQHESALQAELRAISDRGQPDVILIDDARHTGHQPGLVARLVRQTMMRRRLPVRPGYPALADIQATLMGRIESFEVRRDVIRIKLTRSGDAGRRPQGLYSGRAARSESRSGVASPPRG